jgi:L-lactate dehydrogenase (cytochrome)
MSISRYFSHMRDPDRTWSDVAQMIQDWGGKFCLKGVMTAADALRAAEIGRDAVNLSNHSGRQLDGSCAPFHQLAEVVDAAGNRLDILMAGGVTRGTHVLKALSLGARAVGVGSYYLFPLAAAGQAGLERALGLMRDELIRDMKLMVCRNLRQR